MYSHRFGIPCMLPTGDPNYFQSTPVCNSSCALSRIYCGIISLTFLQWSRTILFSSQAVRDSLKEDYQCANPLIKCQILTCTRQLPNNVSDIAKKLFKRYKKARHVQLEKKNDSSSRRLVPKSKKRKNKGRSRRKHKRTDTREIVYLTKSRNFCVKDERRQLPGTEGRECGRKELNDDKSTARTRTCNYLCCDRGTVTNTTSWVDNRYKCKFSFKIMDVICKTRLVRREVVTCR